jgi:hypothetical protein
VEPHKNQAHANCDTHREDGTRDCDPWRSEKRDEIGQQASGGESGYDNICEDYQLRFYGK